VHSNRQKFISYAYLASSAIPLLSIVLGIFWASGKQGFDAWGIVTFLLFGGAWGVVNLLLGFYVLSIKANPAVLRVFIGIGFLVGGILPTVYLLFILGQ